MTQTELLLIGCDSKFIENSLVNTVEVIIKYYEHSFIEVKCETLNYR